MEPKVLLGCPTFEGKEYALKRYAEAIKRLTYKNVDVVLIDNSDNDDYKKKLESYGFTVIKSEPNEDPIERMVEARNILRTKCLEGGYDYFFSLEQDVTPPKDVIERLLKWDVPVVSGLYYNFFENNFKKIEMKPVAYHAVSEEHFEMLRKDPKYKGTEVRKKIETGIIKNRMELHAQLSHDEVEEKKIMEVLFTGLGCMLIRRDVFKNIVFRATKTSFDDYNFCIDAHKQGFDVWLDTSVKCSHLVQKQVKNAR